MGLFWILAGIGGALLLDRILGGMTVLVSDGPGGAAAASGSMGGTTWSHNRFGMYTRRRTKPVNPNTDRQALIRASLGSMTQRWANTLSAGQRAAWNLYASSVVMKNKIGQDTFLTGFNHYLRSNVIRDAQSLPVIDNGPTVFELPAHDPDLALTASEATQQLTIAYDAGLDWADEDGGFLIMFQGSPQNAQRNFFAGPWRYTGVHFGAQGAPPASPVIQTVQFAIAQGQRQWIYARILRADGRQSQPFRADDITGA